MPDFSSPAAFLLGLLALAGILALVHVLLRFLTSRSSRSSRTDQLAHELSRIASNRTHRSDSHRSIPPIRFHDLTRRNRSSQTKSPRNLGQYRSQCSDADGRESTCSNQSLRRASTAEQGVTDNISADVGITVRHYLKRASRCDLRNQRRNQDAQILPPGE
jgi:hypothetical protein